jgi:hypothetical protein
VDEGDTLSPFFESIVDCGLDQSPASEFADRFDSYSRIRTDLPTIFVQKVLQQILCFLASGLQFKTDVDIFGVFPENNHVHLFRFFHGTGNTGEMADGLRQA